MVYWLSLVVMVTENMLYVLRMSEILSKVGTVHLTSQQNAQYLFIYFYSMMISISNSMTLINGSELAWHGGGTKLGLLGSIPGIHASAV